MDVLHGNFLLGDQKKAKSTINIYKNHNIGFMKSQYKVLLESK